MRTFLALFIALCLNSAVLAQDRGAGFQILNNAPSPYALSKAEATISMADGAASVYSNPALLVANSSSSIDLGYSFWIADETNIFGGVNFLRNRSAIAFTFYTSGSGNYEQRNTPGQSNGNFSIQYLSIAAAYSYDFKYFTLGGALQYLNESIYTYRASGYAFNLGAATHFLDGKIRAGASLSNIGEMEELDVEATKLPANFKAGLSADIFEINPKNNTYLPVLIRVFGDLVYPLSGKQPDYVDYLSDEPYFNIALAVNVAEVVEVSGGFKPDNDVRPFSFGTSFNMDNIQVNYALVPFKTGLGTVHSIGLQYKF